MGSRPPARRKGGLPQGAQGRARGGFRGKVRPREGLDVGRDRRGGKDNGKGWAVSFRCDAAHRRWGRGVTVTVCWRWGARWPWDPLCGRTPWPHSRDHPADGPEGGSVQLQLTRVAVAVRWVRV